MRLLVCRLVVNVAIATIMCISVLKIAEAAAAKKPRTILLIGPNDAAKQLVGNCLLSSSSRQDAPPLNMSHPFSSRQSASEMHCSAFMNGDQLVVIDAYGVGDSRVDQHFALRLLQKSLSAVRNQVHLVLVVFKRRDIVGDALLAYVRLFNQQVLKSTRAAQTISPNVAFVCDDEEKEIGATTIDNNQHYQQLLAIVERKRVFRIDLTTAGDNYDYRPRQGGEAAQFGKRSLAPNDGWIETSRRLIAFVDQMPQQLDLAHVQDKHFVGKMVVDTRQLFVEASLTAKHKRRIILVGYTGAGKSTVGNCLYNKLPTLYHVQSHPFETSDSANGCTSNPTVLSNDEFVLIDTVGFGDPHRNQTSVIEAFQHGLAMLNNTVDLVVFVMKRERFTTHIADFFKHIHNDVFRGLMRDNSVLVCSGCKKGWLADNRRSNQALNHVLDLCADRSVEFKLNFEIPDTDMPPHVLDFYEQNNENSRNKTINKLIGYLRALNVSKVNLDYIQEPRFKKLFLEQIAFKLIKANHEEIIQAANVPTAAKYAAQTGVGVSVITLGINLVRFVDPVINVVSFVYLTAVGVLSLFNFGSLKINALVNKCLVSFQFEVRQFGPESPTVS